MARGSAPSGIRFPAKNRCAFACIQRIRVEPELLGQRMIEPDQSRLGYGLRRQGDMEALRQPRIAVVEGKRQSRDVRVGIGLEGLRRDRGHGLSAPSSQ